MLNNNYLVKSIINETTVYSSNNSTVLQACSNVGIEIPRYCFHNRLSIAGNCRMCLVEVYGVEKPVISCAQTVTNNLHILTNSEVVRRMREGISKFLLYNHPLDCAICDQGGECDLQDQVMVYGTDKSRFYDYKRTVLDKECGPLIKTVMTRCIHCTRCVRFLQEVAGTSKLGVLGRGQTMEIGNYVDEIINSELSGNIIDLCPVGALTSKPSALSYRSWELRSSESFDLFDSVNSSIRVDMSYSDIVRISPSLNESINEEWIHDKIRFSFDGLSYQRLSMPLKRVGSSLVSISWESALVSLKSLFLKNMLRDNKLSVNFSSEFSLENITLLNKLLSVVGNGVGKSLDSLRTKFVNNDFFSSGFLNLKLSDFSSYDNIILLGHDFRKESPILNLRLRQSKINSGCSFYYTGSPLSSNFPMSHLGINPLDSTLLSKGGFIDNLSGKTLVLGNREILGENSIDLLNSYSMTNSNMFVHVFSNKCNSSTLSNLGLFGTFSQKGGVNYPLVGGKSLSLGEKQSTFSDSLSFDINTNDTLSSSFTSPSSENFSIYLGHHGDDAILSSKDLVLPSLTPLEEGFSHYNINNIFQESSSCLSGPKNSRSTKNFLSLVLKLSNLLFKEIDVSRVNSNIFKEVKYSSNKKSFDILLPEFPSWFEKRNVVNSNFNNLFSSSYYFDDFYKTDLTSGSSKVMSNCSRNISLSSNYIIS